MVASDRRYWTGLPLNPLPFLREAERAALAVDARDASGGEREARVARTVRTVRPTVPTASDTLGAEGTPRR